ncbi:MFS transporter [Desulfosporosinus shakirovi]|uniref:MFS transporter n=1 Tax=Desulfosporosinus shakirovi TaxID=2885154 RepID=UPI001E6548E6|nr:MFS transporter [Desulfosporosinus sp. SRJS8]MCB8817844.1 MFS transporter [Desulfosporosinus sp. SRJS8]
MSTLIRKKNNYFDGLPVSKKQMFLFVLIVFSYFFEQMDNNNFAFIAPALIKSGFLIPSQVATITGIYFLGMTLGGLLGGFISDLIGRRKTFLTAMFIFSSMSILNGTTSDFGVFLIARAATGFGIFMMMVTSIAYIAEISPGESRGKWQSLTAAGGFCAMPIIGMISRAIIPSGPEAWRIIFYIGGLGFITFFLGLIYLKESPRWLVSKGRVADAEKVVKELSGMDVDLSDVAKTTPPKLSTSEQLVGMFSGKYLKRTSTLLAIGIPATIASFALVTWIPTLASMRGFTLEQSINIGVAFMFGGPFGLLISSSFSDKGGRKIPLTITILLTGILALGYAFVGNNYVLTLIIAFLLNAASMSYGFIAMAYAPEHYPTKMRNTSVGIINAIQRLAVAFSQPLIPLIAAGYGASGVFIGVFALFILAAAVVFFLGQRTGGVPLEQIE